MIRMRRVAARPGSPTLGMPPGSPGRISEPAGPSRSADSERTVTRVLRSKARHYYTQDEYQCNSRGTLGLAATSCGPKLDDAHLNGDPDPFRGEPAQDPPPDLMLNRELIREGPHVADQ